MHELDFDSLQLMNGTPADPGAVAVAAALLPGEPCGPRSSAFLGGACLPQFGQLEESAVIADCLPGQQLVEAPGIPAHCVTILEVDCAEGEVPGPFGCVPEGTIPGAVKVRPSNWDLATQPAEYRLAAGDTMVGLAATYLFEGARWRDIWDTQTPSFRAANSPDVIFAGTTIRMPDEARDNFVRFLKKEVPPPGGVIDPGTPKGPVPKTEKEESRSRTLLFVAAGAAVAGVVMIAVAKKPRRTRRRRG